MRLLDKKDIDKARSEEKRLAIDQGARIAKRVDDLRETHGREEESLRKFREETIKGIHLETNALLDKKSSLEIEVSDLEIRKEEALKPLDSEWDRLASERIKLEDDKKSNNRLIVHLISKEKELSDELDKAGSNVRETQLNLKEAENSSLNASEDRYKASETLKDAETYKSKTESVISTRVRELNQRETGIAVRERNSQLRDAGQDNREKELNNRETALMDREQTLEREIKRLQKNG